MIEKKIKKIVYDRIMTEMKIVSGRMMIENNENRERQKDRRQDNENSD